MENLLEENKIHFERKNLNNNYSGYILYSKNLGELEDFWLEDLKQYKLYNKCSELKETAAFRYLYYQELTNNLKHEKLIIIMMNPSLANSTTLDPTIKNINRYLEQKNYRSFEIVNLHHIRTPKPAHLQSYLKKHSNSDYQDILKNYIEQNKNKKDCKIVAAWGGNYHKVALGILQKMKLNYEEDFYAYALNKEKDPRHFSNLAYNKKDKYNDFKKIKDIITDLDV